MTTTTYEPLTPETDLRRQGIRLGDVVFKGIAIAAALATAALLGLIAWKVFDLAWPAMQEFGLSFVWTEAWDPVTEQFGALIFIYGTVATSVIALVIATPLSIAIALFLSEIAPRRVAAPIATMVELLAAIPSVVLGLWGILVLGPFITGTLGPAIHGTFGWIPIFSTKPTVGSNMFAAILILTIMIVPIVSSICRELFVGVPQELKDGALALGATRWEVVRGVVFPYARAGIAAALILGLGRAVGEAIAVTQVIGNNVAIHTDLFKPGDTLASRIAGQYQGADTALQVASLVYLAVILLVFSLIANLAAQLIVRRVAGRHQMR